MKTFLMMVQIVEFLIYRVASAVLGKTDKI